MSELRKPSFWVSLFVTWLLLVAAYLLFTSNLQKEEVYAGLAVGVVATIASATLQSLGLVRFRPRGRDLIQAWRLPWYMVSGAWELTKALCQQLFTTAGCQSIVYAVPFDMGGDAPPDVSRRTLATVYTTLTPNFVILGFIPEQRLLLYHQVLQGPVLKMTEKLGARP